MASTTSLNCMGAQSKILSRFFHFRLVTSCPRPVFAASVRMSSSTNERRSGLANLRAMQEKILIRKRQAQKSNANKPGGSSKPLDVDDSSRTKHRKESLSVPKSSEKQFHAGDPSDPVKPLQGQREESKRLRQSNLESRACEAYEVDNLVDAKVCENDDVNRSVQRKTLFLPTSISRSISGIESPPFRVKEQMLGASTEEAGDFIPPQSAKRIVRSDGALPRKLSAFSMEQNSKYPAKLCHLPTLEYICATEKLSSVQRSDGNLPRAFAALSVTERVDSHRPERATVQFDSGNDTCFILETLNDSQRSAVVAELGRPCLVLAGPGSGKTRVLTHRAAHLVKNCRVHPSKVLAVTFTNKAANEMRDRIAALLEDCRSDRADGIGEMSVGTFHSICALTLRLYGVHIGISEEFNIADTSDAREVLSSVFKQNENLTFSAEAVNMHRRQISMLKNDREDELQKKLPSRAFRMLLEIRELYDSKLRAMNMLDFDDLLLETRKLLQQCDEIRRTLQSRYHHVLVDEWQDTNTVQYDIVKYLTENGRNIFVVGDADQSIYKFRGADYKNITRFEQDFPDMRKVTLSENYRSSACIVQAAQAVIQMNSNRHDKPMITSNAFGKPITLAVVNGPTEEAAHVIRKIGQMRKSDETLGLADFAILYRTNSQSRAFEEACVTAGIPYRLIGGTRFYERQEIKDMLAYLRLVRNPADNISCARVINVPPRGIGIKTMTKLESVASSRNESLMDLLDNLFASDDECAVQIDLRESSLKGLREFHHVIAQLRSQASLSSCTADQCVAMVTDLTQYKSYLESGTQTAETLNKVAERWGNIEELMAAASRHASLGSFLESVALVSDVGETQDDEGNLIRPQAVSLMTMHSGKGLEFSCVFMTGMEEGLVPMIFKDDNAQDSLEEERRLAYVGMTRAKSSLILTRRARRMLPRAKNGIRLVDIKPSRFLSDIPKYLISEENLVRNRPSAHERRGRANRHQIDPPVQRTLSYDSEGNIAAPYKGTASV